MPVSSIAAVLYKLLLEEQSFGSNKFSCSPITAKPPEDLVVNVVPSILITLASVSIQSDGSALLRNAGRNTSNITFTS
jgi:hypothetical protein